MPIACYAVEKPMFQPAMRIVTAITNASIAQVTTSFAHQYATGLIIRLVIPLANGMQNINGIEYPITVTSPTTFTIPVSTILFQPFTNVECAKVVPTGEINSLLTQATRNTLPYPAT